MKPRLALAGFSIIVVSVAVLSLARRVKGPGAPG